jgi:hypothetical protein
MNLHKTLLAAALATAGLMAADPAAAQYNTRDQVRMIEREYERLYDGRRISDAQLEYYLDRADAGWTMEQIRRDMAGYTNTRNPWRPRQGYVAREVICSSIDGRYQECPVPFRGTAVITQQLSDSSCIQGRTWGQRAGEVWVSRGCRARFGIVGGGVARRDNLNDRRVVCASNRGAYRECATGFRGDVMLSRQLNNSANCVEGRNWGQRPGLVWVRGGCRAQFESVGRRGPRDDVRAGGVNSSGRYDVFRRDPNYVVTCTSVNGRREVCTWDTRYGTPRMIERLSNTACVEGRDWGYDARGQLWVDAGCRARFGYR